jgi:phosphotransferase system  glucose/maltose/N-acetylglucosamine-specific IIC component
MGRGILRWAARLALVLLVAVLAAAGFLLTVAYCFPVRQVR